MKNITHIILKSVYNILESKYIYTKQTKNICVDLDRNNKNLYYIITKK